MKKTLLITFLLFFSSTTFATPINTIVFFGDSLSDNGNLYRLTNQILPKSPPYYNGRFSNGPVWTEILSHYLYQNYKIVYYNYAVGGAMVVPHGIITYLHKFLATEITQYLNANPEKTHTLYTIWIGANDYLDAKITDANKISQEVSRVISGIESAINTLINQGGRYFMIFNLPDLSKTPFETTSNNRNIVKMLISSHNQQLDALIIKLKKNHPQVKLIYHHIYDDFEQLFKDPILFSGKYQQHILDSHNACYPTHEYGYWIHQINSQRIPPLNIFFPTNTSYSSDLKEAAQTTQLFNLFGISPCPSQENYAFWDRLHPTFAVHSILAQIAFNTLLKSNLF